MFHINDNAGKLIKISDSFSETMKDEARLNNRYPAIGGLVVVKNSHGDVLLRKNNLVVFRGRLFALEKIFGQMFNVPYSYGSIDPDLTGIAGTEKGTNPADISDIVKTTEQLAQPGATITPNYATNQASLLNRRVCLFGIGSGGVANEAWFSPSTVVPSSTRLVNPIAFCNSDSEDYRVNPEFYYGAEVDGDGKSQYFLKRINSKDANDNFLPCWVYDKATNTIAMMNTLHINESFLSNPPDGIIKRVNELALYMATETIVGGKSTFTNIEMFSRVTFDTESLYSNKEMLIEYYIFA